MIALVNGEPATTIPVTDSAVLRGDGCFEAMKSYGGLLFALPEHLDRMEHSAAALGLTLPERADVELWCRQVASRGGDGVVRVVVSRGDVVPGSESRPRCLVLYHPLPARSDTIRLGLVPAPWHPAGRSWELSGVKTISYAANLAAGRKAQAAGFDDALLIADDETVLEGPTFCVGWVVDGRIETPELGLGILESITRRHVLGVAATLGIEIEEGRFPLAHLDRASEFMVWSTSKEVTPVVAVGDHRFDVGPVAARLATGFLARVEEVTSAELGMPGVGRLDPTTV